ncbi:glycosyltransferase family 2 protein [Flavobacterium gilvum]|uniref:Glycosyltransferase 2-like domain-containing protein n=1 Tax=Flavobacterium gilvum TaxID=1492737 RepID=A0AAC9I590_9FLAO|nr:glycosyltransferase family A protein [Flavobacterium gilvum]AOW08147.1 hypothetical protein EM308_00730 [Flavobacterium gilvum]KFC59360.1 hypothetical protein FEM08_19640 [Flavobacterium gilvum]
MTKISVVVPIFNASSRITKVLDSVLRQSFPVFEIILINDCSKDDTSKVLEKYIEDNKKITFKVFDLKVNKGVSFCRNLGWDNASGDYIAFLDSDDFWNQNKLEIMSNIISSSEVDLIGHNYNEKGSSLNEFFIFNPQLVYKISFYKLLIRNKFQTSCVLIKKGIKERFDTSISHSEDYELFLRLTAKKYNVVYYNERLTYLGRPQLSKGGLSEKKMKMRIGEIKTYRSGLYIRKIGFLLPVMMIYSFFKSLIKINR